MNLLAEVPAHVANIAGAEFGNTPCLLFGIEDEMALICLPDGVMKWTHLGYVTLDWRFVEGTGWVQLEDLEPVDEARREAEGPVNGAEEEEGA